MYAYGGPDIPGNPMPNQQYGTLVVFEGVLSSRQRIVLQILRPYYGVANLYARTGEFELDDVEFTDEYKWVSYTGVEI